MAVSGGNGITVGLKTDESGGTHDARLHPISPVGKLGERLELFLFQQFSRRFPRGAMNLLISFSPP